MHDSTRSKPAWKRRLLGLALSTGLGFSGMVGATEVNTTGLAVTDDTVKVGILHSITGTMAISETGSVEAEMLAIEQINAAGGVLGRQIEIIQEDGASDWPTFAEKARKLLGYDTCWTMDEAIQQSLHDYYEKNWPQASKSKTL